MSTTSPRRKSTPKPVKVAKLHQHPETGAICALSSDGVTRYVVRNTADGNWTCTCPGFTHHGHCYHVASAAQRFGGFFARPAVTAVIVPVSEPEPPAGWAAPAALPVAGSSTRGHVFHIGGRVRRAA